MSDVSTSDTDSSEISRLNVYELRFPLKKGDVPSDEYRTIFNVFLYRKHVLNWKYPTERDCKDKRIYVESTDCNIEKTLKEYNNYIYSYNVDGYETLVTYCIGYNIKTIRDIYGNDTTFQPVFDNNQSDLKINLHWELEKKYKKLIKRYRNFYKWDFLISFHVRGKQSGVCIPLEIAEIIYTYYLDEF